MPVARLSCCSEDAFAARMCFLHGASSPAERARITLLSWTFAEARLDTYRVDEPGQQFEIIAGREAARPPAALQQESDDGGDDLDDNDDTDLLEELEAAQARKRRRTAGPAAAGRRRPHGQRRMLPDAEAFDPLQAMIQEGTDGADAAAQPVLEELDEIEDAEQAAASVAEDVQQQQEEEDAQQQPQQRQEAASSSDPRTDQPRAAVFDIRSSPIFDSGCWHFRKREGNASVGTLHQVTAVTVKATCKLHRSCACMVSMPPTNSERLRKTTARLGRPPTAEDLQNDLIEWLAAGCATDARQHDIAGRRMRAEKWAVKVRGGIS